jgi:hypothetical protein
VVESRSADLAGVLLDAAQKLGDEVEPDALYARFHELLDDVLPHDGIVISSYDAGDGDRIRCEYAWVEGNDIDPSTLPLLRLNRDGGGMQSRVILTGEPLLINDVAEQVRDEGTYYNVDRQGAVKKIPQSPVATSAAMMVPVKQEGRVVGVVQLMRDAGVYGDAGFRPAKHSSGDVLARLNVRIAEFEESIRLIREFSAMLAAGEEMPAEDFQTKSGCGFGYVEGWRGPVLYWGKLDADGRIDRCKITDASFKNWQGLAYCVHGNIIPDFPLCNKSFDLSYSGNDL